MLNRKPNTLKGNEQAKHDLVGFFVLNGILNKILYESWILKQMFICLPISTWVETSSVDISN